MNYCKKAELCLTLHLCITVLVRHMLFGKGEHNFTVCCNNGLISVVRLKSPLFYQLSNKTKNTQNLEIALLHQKYILKICFKKQQDLNICVQPTIRADSYGRLVSRLTLSLGNLQTYNQVNV